MSKEIREMIDKIRNFSQSLNEVYVGIDGKLQDMSQSDINEILKGYIECALWTEEENLKDEATSDIEDYDDMDDVEKIIQLKGKLDKKTFTAFVSEDIDLDSKIEAYNDIKTFIKTAGDNAVQEAINENGLFKLGMDIWFTRNGHGAGFFDHNYENEDILINAGKNLKPIDIYIGDDGKLHFM